ncbi:MULTISPECIES: hypothetical protein [unclassified Streptomyces]|uniref:hypothetical protein n=1 Tax=unclassified Streptomyces TaxID=2593676 RepID=UPI001BE9DF11|nr:MULTISPECIES: hypothetical protein [unclassified Streptomyces]MBT2402438.1 hypothetical protein [Streptomyces sp. ISL-21]MBT2455064.1 hypothetical protein [Streptomyces sp. ISL-86]MBT2611558.1 hypothetical protein [Streptomyces sp. ISL-87]
MSAAGAERAHRADVPRTSGVSMGALLAAGVAATAVSTPPARLHVRDEGAGSGPGPGELHAATEQAAPGSEAA